MEDLFDFDAKKFWADKPLDLNEDKVIASEKLCSLSETYPDLFENAEQLSQADESTIRFVIQQMHKINGGQRKLREHTVDLMLKVYIAFAQVKWEALGVRGIYYRVVSIYGLPKTEKTYKDIQRISLQMRRIGVLDYKYVVDGSRHTYGTNTYENVDSFFEDISYAYHRDLWVTSEYRVEVTVEKDAMRDILLPVTQEYGVNLSPTKGFNSETAWYTIAENYKNLALLKGKTPVLLMLTDYDTSGLQMMGAAEAAFKRFGVDPITMHVGLTPKQIAKFDLPTRPDKKDHMMNAVELDAMTPEQARGILRDALDLFADRAAMDSLREQEQRERDDMRNILKK